MNYARPYVDALRPSTDAKPKVSASRPTIDARKRKMLVDVFGSDLAASILGEKIEKPAEPPQPSEADIAKAQLRYYHPYVADYLIPLHRYGNSK